MCGLTLVINKNKNGFNYKQQEIFSSLMYRSGGYRGRDGAGVALIDNIGNVKMAKDGESVDNFLQTDEYKALDKQAFQNGWAMIGHNRAATRGTIVDKNSHPFIIDDNIVLVHNGTFSGDHKHLKDTEVDSEAIGHVIAEHKDIEEALRKVNAAYALMWYNVADKTINIIRNSQRTLWFMELDNAYVFSSEEPFLQFVMNKHNITPMEGPSLLKEHLLCSYLLKDNGETEETCKEVDVSYFKHNTNFQGGASHGYPFRHRGWVGGKCVEDDHETTWAASTKVSTYDVEILSKSIHILRDKLVPTLYKDWDVHIKSRKYDTKKEITVIVDEVIEVTKNGNDYVFIGRTLDGSNIPTLFLLDDLTFNQALEMATHSLFEMSVVGLHWKRWDAIYPVNPSDPMDKWPGIMILHGNKARSIYMHEGVVNA